MKVSTSVVIETKDGLVFMKRSQNCRDCKGLWAFAGGEVDENETITDCAIREAKEEVGMDITVYGIGSPITHVSEAGYWCMIPVFARTFNQHPINVEPNKCDEVKILKYPEDTDYWVISDDIMTDNTIANATKAVMKSWSEQCKNFEEDMIEIRPEVIV